MKKNKNSKKIKKIKNSYKNEPKYNNKNLFPNYIENIDIINYQNSELINYKDTVE